MTEEQTESPVTTPARGQVRSAVFLLVLVISTGLGLLHAERKREARTEMAPELVHAVIIGDVDKVRKLVQSGADVNAIPYAHTALYEALWSCHIDCAEYLLSHGARTDLDKDPSVGNLLEVATFSPQADRPTRDAQLKIVRRLIDEGEDVNYQDHLGGTSISIACYHGDVGLAQELIAHGANVNVVDDLGQTPLHQASYANHTEVAALLLQHGANPLVANKKGETPRMLAVHKGNAAIVRLLDAPPASVPVR